MNFEGCTPQPVLECNHPDGCSVPAALKGMCKRHYHRNWDRSNKEKRNAKHKAWADANPHKVTASRRRTNVKLWAPIKEYKESIGCVRCGFNRDGRILAFHHKDRATKDKSFRHYHIYFTIKPRRTMAELEKCIILCHNCHAEEHARSFLPTGANGNARRKWKTGKAFRVYKESIGCQRCGYARYGGALTFHHVDPTTKNRSAVITGEGWYYRNLAVLAEIAKCIMLCKNCHCESHLEERA